MYVKLDERRFPDAAEAVNLPRFDDKNIPGAGFEILAVDCPEPSAFPDELRHRYGYPARPWIWANARLSIQGRGLMRAFQGDSSQASGFEILENRLRRTFSVRLSALGQESSPLCDLLDCLGGARIT